jgi:hypothetical protein
MSLSTRGFVSAANAPLCSSSAFTVIAANAIAARPAARTRDSSNIGPPTGATNRVPKAGSIIATGNARTAGARLKPPNQIW